LQKNQKKIITVDYVRETNKYAKFYQNPSTGASSKMSEI